MCLVASPLRDASDPDALRALEKSNVDGNHVTDNVSNLEVLRDVTYSMRIFCSCHFCNWLR